MGIDSQKYFQHMRFFTYDKDMFEKKFYGFKRHSNNPNYVRLPKSELTLYRKITADELDRMDNTLFDNWSPPQTVRQTTTTVMPTTMRAPECDGTERDTYDKCPEWQDRCHLPQILQTCAYSCNNCEF